MDTQAVGTWGTLDTSGGGLTGSYSANGTTQGNSSESFKSLWMNAIDPAPDGWRYTISGSGSSYAAPGTQWKGNAASGAAALVGYMGGSPPPFGL